MTIQELFTRKGSWIKGGMARDANGAIVSTHSPKATGFCLVGALFRCYPDTPNQTVVMQRLNSVLTRDHAARGDGDFSRLAIFNDDPTTRLEHVRTLVAEANV